MNIATCDEQATQVDTLTLCARRRDRRRGVATLWTILVLPLFVLTLVFVTDIGYLWLARVELENAAEAAALAAVKEWAESPSGSTLPARLVGVELAGANTINGIPLVVDPNHDPNNAPNENATINNGLIFGAVVSEDRPWVFDPNQRPGCGPGNVLFDATGQGGGPSRGGMGTDNAWGVSFTKTPDDDPKLYIKTIVIDLRDGGGSGMFVRPVVLSNNTAPHAVVSPSVIQPNDQVDIFGLDDTVLTFSDVGTKRIYENGNISFTHDSTTPHLLTIDFSPHAFKAGDRFRFGMAVIDVGSGPTSDDGDGIGDDRVGVSVLFSSSPTPVTGTFVDTTHKKNDCVPTNPQDDPVESDNGNLIVHPSLIPDLPCPSSSSGANNGQSFVSLGGGTNRAFAVRVRITLELPSLSCHFGGIDFGPYEIIAEATAMIDCDTLRPRLIRICDTLPD